MIRTKATKIRAISGVKTDEVAPFGVRAIKEIRKLGKIENLTTLKTLLESGVET